MKVLVIPSSGDPRVEELDHSNPNGLLQQLNELVGGYIEVVGVRVRFDAAAYINEDGKMLGLPRNQLATRMLRVSPGDYIVGDAVVFGYDPRSSAEQSVPEDLAEAWL